MATLPLDFFVFGRFKRLHTSGHTLSQKVIALAVSQMLVGKELAERMHAWSLQKQADFRALELTG